MVERIRRTRPRELQSHGQCFEGLVPGALVCALFAAVLAFGGSRVDVALIFASLWGAFSLVLVTTRPNGLLIGSRLGFWIPLLGFAAFIAANLLVVAGVGVSAPRAWTYVTSPPSGVLDRSLDLIELIKLAGLACLYLVGSAIGVSRESTRRFIAALLMLSCAYGLCSFVWFGLPPIVLMEGIPRTSAGRLAGTFLSPNSAATFFAMLLFIALWELARQMRKPGVPRLDDVVKRCWFGALTAVILGVDLLLTGSRTGAAATVAVGVAWLVAELVASRVMLKRGPNRKISALLVSAAVLLLILWSGAHLLDRYNLVHEDIAVRGNIFQAHWDAASQSLWQGSGLGAFDLINSQLMNSNNFIDLWNINATHNAYLQWLEEAGLICCVLFAITLLAPLALTGARLGEKSEQASLQRCLLAASCVILLHSLTDFSVQVYSIASLWAVLLGIGVGVASSRSDSTPRRSRRNSETGRPARLSSIETDPGRLTTPWQ